MAFNKELWDKMTEFQDYLESDKWKQKREERYKKDNHQCVLCKSNKRISCHHLTYARLYKEDINDLITFCNKCHQRIHKISPPHDIPDFVKQTAIDKVYAPSTEDMVKLMWKNCEEDKKIQRRIIFSEKVPLPVHSKQLASQP